MRVEAGSYWDQTIPLSAHTYYFNKSTYCCYSAICNGYLAFTHHNTTFPTLNCKEDVWHQELVATMNAFTMPNGSCFHKMQVYRKECPLNFLLYPRTLSGWLNFILLPRVYVWHQVSVSDYHCAKATTFVHWHILYNSCAEITLVKVFLSSHWLPLLALAVHDITHVN